MDTKSSLLMNTSLLQHCMQKYYDTQLAKYHLNARQLTLLIMIYELEGITIDCLATKGFFDKEMIIEEIRELELQDYVTLLVSKENKLITYVYTTDKTKETIVELYEIRHKWSQILTSDMSKKEIVTYESLQLHMITNALAYEENKVSTIKIFGLQKLTLLDYPGKVSSTIFTGGCNFRCPYCQNSDLVFLPEDIVEITSEDVLLYLKKRVGILEGVCISGGEPLVQAGLEDFLIKVKALGYFIKLDTNGYYPHKLKELVERGLIDYVAMDIKNSPSNYASSTGVKSLDLSAINESIQYLLTGSLPYEFRTTIVKEFHEEKDIYEISDWIKEAKAYYLQNFEDSKQVICSGLHACSKEELVRFQKILLVNIPNTNIRGI